MITLRDYQLRAVDAAVALVRAGKRKILLVAPTAAGKTVTFAEIVRRSAEKEKRCVIVAHRRELITQASNKLDAFGVEHGVILAGHKRWKPWEPIQVASIQTLTAREHTRPKSCDLIVYDEAHHTRSATSEALLKWYPNAVILGVTATPWRSDNRGLGEIFEESYVVATPKQLLSEGYLVPCTGFVFQSPNLDALKRTRGGDFKQDQLDELAKDVRLSGDVVAQWLGRAGGVRTVVFAVSVDHSLTLAEKFRAAGVKAEHLDGNTKLEERAEIIARLRSGETRVVTNVNVLTEGTDIPELECVVIARPTASTALYLQMVGRALRTHPGKTIARLHDHAGCVAAHGGPFEDRDYSLSADVERRKSSSGGTTEAWRVCKKCQRYNDEDTFTCIGCGAQLQRPVTRIHEDPEARVIALEDMETPESLNLAWTPRARKQFYMSTAAALLHKGRRLGAAAHAYKKKFGQYPPWEWTREMERWWRAQNAEHSQR